MSMNYVKILGASGSKTKNAGTTSFQVSKEIIIDAGNVINTLGDNAQYINHIFLTHSHSDHIIDLPFIIESLFEKRKETLTIYASKETISSLRSHTFNDEIWPDFSKINLIGTNKPSLVFKEININDKIIINNYEIKVINANHIPGAYGFTVIKDNIKGYLISGDTYLNEDMVEELNNDRRLKIIIIECSFPSRMEKLAYDSKHLTPKLLVEQLKNLKREDIQVFIYHIKHIYYEEMEQEIKDYRILKYGGKILEEGDVIHINTGEIETDMLSHTKFQRIMDINLELASELDKDKLLDMILSLTRELTHSQGGTLYTISDDKKYLDFKVVQNKPLNIFMGGTGNKIDWPSLPLFDENGLANTKMVAVTSAINKEIVNIPDVYSVENYDFSGTKKFDANTGFRSKSMLVMPLKNHEDDIIGVLQLINKTKVSGTVIEFDKNDEKIIKALAAHAAMALTNTQLIESLEGFLNSFVSTIARAIDAKSKHTMNHIGKVAKISTYIAKAIHEDETVYKDVKYSANDFRQIELAALMHDIGKISMPESVIDKATKLQIMTDGIYIIEERVEILKRDFEIEYLKNQITKEEFEAKVAQLEDDLEFIKTTNIGGEFMRDEDIQRVGKIAEQTYMKGDKETNLITTSEKYNLCIRRGTLTVDEKAIMNSHAQLSYDMLAELPFPKKYNKVMHIAANHHEKLNGKGYPRGLSEKELTLEDRIMILADIFEALTANDRPYKDAKKLSEVFKILSFMVKDGEIDGELLRFFHQSDVLKKYMEEELLDYQLDKSRLYF